MDNLLTKVHCWAKTSNDVEALVLVGSRARTDHPADEYSDCDIISIVEDPKLYIYRNDWLQVFGSYRLTFHEPTIGGGLERRVMFDSGIYVDFLFFTPDQLRRGFENNEFQGLFQHGYQVLVDKNLSFEVLTKQLCGGLKALPPNADEFLNLVHNFWFHTVWTAKKLRRGEIWSAKYCLDVYLKGLLLTMIEWYTHCKKGWDYNTWYSGRFIDEWADDHITKSLRYAFSRYESEGMVRALLVTMQLFKELSTDVATNLRYEYPQEAEEWATKWIQKCFGIGD